MKTLVRMVIAGFLLIPSMLPAQRKVTPYPYIREADVMWSKKVWEVIDLREKMNQDLYYPLIALRGRRSLFDILKEGVMPTETSAVPALTAYSGDESELKTRLSLSELRKMFTQTDTVYMPDPVNPDVLVKTVSRTDIGPGDVKQYWIQEEWVFDKQRSVLDVRITAIMPVIEKKNEKGDAVGMAATFWVSFPELRYLLVNNYIFNRHNDSPQISYDDLFIKRMFSGYIIKEDNEADRMIADYKGGNTLDALLEAESIKDVIRRKESDLWHH